MIHPGLDELRVPVADLRPYGRNPRRGSVDVIVESLERNGQYRPVVVNKRTMEVLAGNHTLAAARRLGWPEVAATFVDVDDDEAARIALVDNRASDVSGYDNDVLFDLLDSLPDLEGTGFDDAFLERLAGVADETPVVAPSELDDYVMPPVSVFDARQGEWQARKKEWLALGIRSEIGRDDGLTYHMKLSESVPQTSVFDPVLCEAMYRWFCPADGLVLDPFAGGSVRGVVAALLGRRYYGIELRAEQVDANRQQAAAIIGSEFPTPEWTCGDSALVLDVDAPCLADFLLTCPPYGDLEKYSDDPADLSNMPADEFDAVYRVIIEKAFAHLRDDSFAVFVTGNVRDSGGGLRDIAGLTLDACEAAGARYHNDAVLLTAIGTAAPRARRIFEGAHRLTRVHQYVQVFVKGDPRAAIEKVRSA